MRSFLKSSFLTVLVMLTTSALAGFESCPQFFANGISPKRVTAPSIQRELCFENFAVLHSGQSKTPIFVAEKLNRAMVASAHGEKRSNRFYEEARLPNAERAHLADYLHSGFDKGHQSPAADQPNGNAMAQSFSLANMVPQAPVNNRKAWANIEKATRKYASRAAGDLFIVTGPVFDGQVQTIGFGRVWVPKYLYKLVYDTSSGRAWAHWLENTDEARVGRPISYSELVKRTGIEFLPGLHPRD